MRKITGFIWNAWNTEHIARHGVSPEEAEEVIVNRPLCRKLRNDTYLALGSTEDGRWLAVVFAVGADGRAFVITARDMDEKERRLFRRERRS